MRLKGLSIVIGCAALAGQPIMAQPPVTADFFDGIPADFTLEDRDGNTLSEDVKEYGFRQGDAWVAYFIESEKNMVAASTSWYADAGTSDDRMGLPVWNVRKGDVIHWRARSADKYLPNAYKLVAEYDNKETVLFSTEGEAQEWTYRIVELDGLAGEEVRLTFVDCSTDASLLYVDDIWLGSADKVRAELTVPAYVTEQQPFDITGLLFTDMPTAAEGNIEVKTLINGEEQILDLGHISVQPGASVDFKMPVTAKASEAGELFTVKYEVNVDGVKVSEGEKVIRPIVNYAVCEEITGTWCAWCVKGIATFERLDALYPDSFIGIAIHDQDIMSESVHDYKGQIYSYGHASGLPFAYMMRNSAYTSDFDKYVDVVGQINAMPVAAFVETTVGTPVGGSYPLSTAVTLTDDMLNDRYQLAYVLIENDVFDPAQASEYTQKNAYAGGQNGPCGGYEYKPESIQRMHFEHVARLYVGDYKGIFASLPMYMKRDNRYISENSFELPECVLNPENCEVITLLIDKRTSYIAAADILPLTGGRSSAVTARLSGELSVRDGILEVPAGTAGVTVTDISGRIILTSTSDEAVNLSGYGKGVYVICVATPDGAITRKIAL